MYVCARAAVGGALASRWAAVLGDGKRDDVVALQQLLAVAASYGWLLHGQCDPRILQL